MKQTTALLGLACKAVLLMNLVVKLISSIEDLVGGATNYHARKLRA
jgi:hypothetical protein